MLASVRRTITRFRDPYNKDDVTWSPGKQRSTIGVRRTHSASTKDISPPKVNTTDSSKSNSPRESPRKKHSKSKDRSSRSNSPVSSVGETARSGVSRKDASVQSNRERDVLEYGSKLDCSTKVPASAITFDMVTEVVESWEHGIKTIPSWECIAGELFTRKIMELDPETITMFGFPADTKPDDPALSSDRRFMGIAIKLIKAIDMAVDFLGPDLSPLESVLFDLGGRHGSWNARPYHWPVVGEALFYAFEECMKEKFTKNVRESWTLVYNFLGYNMIQGLLDKYPHFAPAKDPEPSRREGLPHFRVASVPLLTEGGESAKPFSSKMMSEEEMQKLTCRVKIPASSITFDHVQKVLRSWEQGILANPNWEKEAGELFIRYIWKYSPEAIKMFGYAETTKYDDPSLTADKWFMTKGARLIKAIDMALTFLGPDLAPLEETLKGIGRRHYHMNVQPYQWPLVGAALFDVFDDCMGENGEVFTPEVRESWTLLYNFLGYHMIEGLTTEKEACAQ